MRKTLFLFVFALMATTMRGQFTDELLAEFPSNLRAMVGNSWRVMLAVRDGRIDDVRPLLSPDFRMGGRTGQEAFGVLDSVSRRRELDSLQLVRVSSIDGQVIVEMTVLQGGEHREINLQGGQDGLITAIRGLTRNSIYDAPDPLSDVRVLQTFGGIQVVAEQDSASVPFSLWHDCIVLTLGGDGGELTFLFDTGCNLTQLNSTYHQPDSQGLVRLDSLCVGPNIYSLETIVKDLSRMERQLGIPRLDGILGWDFVQNPLHDDMNPVGFGYDLHIDYPRRLLTFYRLDSDGRSPCCLCPQETYPFTLTQTGNLPVLTLKANGQDVRMAFDTGCTGYSLTPQTLNRLSGDVIPTDSTTIGWHDHELTVPAFRIQRLSLGSIEAQSPVVQSFADSRFPEADGFLDIRFFAHCRIGLNYVTRQLTVY